MPPPNKLSGLLAGFMQSPGLLPRQQGFGLSEMFRSAPRDLPSRMGLTEQERRLVAHHAQNVRNIGSGGVRNPDGSISTVRQAVVTGPIGRFYSIPTVWNGKILDEREAVKMATRFGWDKWPSYATPEEADQRYFLMHNFLADDVGGL